MRVLSIFIQHTEADNVAVVIIPSKIQVCDKVRRWVLNIQQDSADENEFKDLFFFKKCRFGRQRVEIFMRPFRHKHQYSPVSHSVLSTYHDRC